jgi:4-hydroxy-4-methyl-2-oxoglutarate aldolase
VPHCSPSANASITTTYRPNGDPVNLAAQLVADALALGAATLHEAGGHIGDLPPALRPVAPAMRLAGPACTVRCPAGDNLWIHRAIYAAQPGAVLVVATGDHTAHWGYWGEIMTVAAQTVGVNGLVLQGGSRDHEALAAIGFPVFSLGPCIRGTVKDQALEYGALGVPIQLGDAAVHPGDLIVGDVDGVVAVPCDRVDDVIRNGHDRVDKERNVIAALREGSTTLQLYDLG